MRAKFNQKITVKAPIDLMLLISLENERQTQEKLRAFIALLVTLNTNHFKFKSLTIIVSDYLNRHYFGEEGALKRGQAWLAENKSTLEMQAIPITVVYWRNLMANPAYSKRLTAVRTLYNEDPAFMSAVNNLSIRHANKSTEENTKNYLFEECAVISLLEGHLSYPSGELNAALSVAVKHFNTPLTYHGYSIYDAQPANKRPKNKVPSVQNVEQKPLQNTLRATFFKAAEIMRREGIYTAEEQLTLFKEFLGKAQFPLQIQSEEVENAPRQDGFK